MSYCGDLKWLLEIWVECIGRDRSGYRFHRSRVVLVGVPKWDLREWVSLSTSAALVSQLLGASKGLV